MAKHLTGFSVIIVAAGTGTRLGNGVPKQYRDINGRSILRHTIDVFASVEGVQDICVVIHPAHEDLFQETIKGLDNVIHCTGGDSRKKSVYNGLKCFSHLKYNDRILIHDAARPFVHPSDIESLLMEMKQHKAATLAIPAVDTMCYADTDDMRESPASRDHLWAIQTPQAFHYGTLLYAHEKNPDRAYTDDTALVSDCGIAVKFVKGSKMNFKITHPEDMALAEAMLKTETRMGQGFDVHAFDDDAQDVTSIRLCGIDILHDRKLKGHSDADVGLHALTDAILGAIGAGDIGQHFPPSNMDFKNMDSAVFLERAMTLLRDRGGVLINADITLICEAPKIGPYRDKITERLSDILKTSKDRLNIKATTTETLGFTGRKEGIAAQAIVSVSLPPER